MDFNSVNKIIFSIGKSIQFVLSKIWWIAGAIGLYYLVKFGWRSYKKYIFGTEWDFLSNYLIRVSEKKAKK